MVGPSWARGAASCRVAIHAPTNHPQRADIEIERQEQLKGPESRARELDELTQIYVARGVPQPLAREVAVALTEHDAVHAHVRDELGAAGAASGCPAVAFGLAFAVCLASGRRMASFVRPKSPELNMCVYAGIDPDALANPWQAAFVSCSTFAAGAGLPLAAAALVHDAELRSLAVAGVATLGLVCAHGCLCLLCTVPRSAGDRVLSLSRPWGPLVASFPLCRAGRLWHAQRPAWRCQPAPGWCPSGAGRLAGDG